MALTSVTVVEQPVLCRRPRELNACCCRRSQISIKLSSFSQEVITTFHGLKHFRGIP